MRAILLHNPTAGAGSHSRDALLSALRAAGYSSCYCSVKDDDFAAALRTTAELVVIAGGDGTVAKAIVQLPNPAVPVAIVPLGTANNIARSMGITDAPPEIADVLRLGRSRRLDIGSARGPWGHRRFVEAVGLGAIAQAIRKKSDGKEDGVERLRRGRRELQELLRRHHALDIEIAVDGLAFAGRVLAIEVLNISYTGPALRLAPHADPGDGKLDIVCIPVSQRDDMASWLEAPHRSPPPVVTRRGRKVVVTGEMPYQRVDDAVCAPTCGEGTIIVEAGHLAANILVKRHSAQETLFAADWLPDRREEGQ
jgi:diacylglycerol kinase (ATP)